MLARQFQWSSVSAFFALIMVCAGASAEEPDYDSFARGLNATAVEVNKLEFPKSLSSIDEENATRFFRRYLSENRLTDALRINLGYPLYSWYDNHANLQRSIATVFSESLLEFFSGKRPKEIQRVRAGDKDAHNHYFFMLTMFVDLLGSEHLSDEEKLALASRVYQMVDSSGLNQTRFRKIDVKRWPTLNLLKAQLLLTCFSSAVDCDQLDEFKKRIPQPGLRGELLDTHDVLVIDNDSLDDAQLLRVQAFLEAMPDNVVVPTAILCYDLLRDKAQSPPVSVHSFAKSVMGFNIFATPVGTPQNQFSPDYREVNADLFTIVIAHEYNHGVDVKYIQQNPHLNELREKSLKSAGIQPENFLRSKFAEGFFKNAPQEFVASIANMYFCSTADTFKYALQKSRQGNYHPMTQFMLVASVYSTADECYFYRIDESGKTRVKTVPSQRVDGLVTRLSFQEKVIQLTLDDQQVVNVTIE